ncbi:MAG TPA: Uma2 family endonuclease [Geminicoccaceae bacterium]|nr:Uma2 family endonuclease [Geminicoccus sp.]HMU51310.1 Uma2 family endonuclease [Geminicoccaceae bacterium]
MTATALQIPTSLDAFLDWEERQRERYELVGGVVRMMSGGTEDHDRLSINLIALMRNALRGSPCYVHGANLKVVSREAGASTYPELFVRCGPRSGKRTRIEDAVVVFEVLSPRTAKDDLTRKRRAYQAIPSMRLIAYVSQDEPRIDLVRREPGASWIDEEISGLASTLEIAALGISLPLSEIYEDTDVADRAA